jgi:hypothetical protein
VVPESRADGALEIAAEMGESAFVLGRVTATPGLRTRGTAPF